MNALDSLYLARAVVKVATRDNNPWEEKSINNVEKWGLQDVESIMLAFDEEWGETVQAYHESTHEDSDGDPLDEQKSLSECTGEQLDRIEEELSDAAALLVQMQAAIERARKA